MAHTEEVAELKAALEACENKWYNEGFTDAKNSLKPVVHQARVQGFEEGWLAALQAMGVPGDSQLWNQEQIPCPTFAPPVQSQADATDEEDTPNMRELVKAIDAHVDLEATNNLNAPINEEVQQAEDAPDQPIDDAVQFFPTNPTA